MRALYPSAFASRICRACSSWAMAFQSFMESSAGDFTERASKAAAASAARPALYRAMASSKPGEGSGPAAKEPMQQIPERKTTRKVRAVRDISYPLAGVFFRHLLLPRFPQAPRRGNTVQYPRRRPDGAGRPSPQRVLLRNPPRKETEMKRRAVFLLVVAASILSMTSAAVAADGKGGISFSA